MTDSSRKLACWIEGFLEYTENLDLPHRLRLWTAIAGIGGMAERRIWTTTGRGVVYPNLFVLLVTPPAIGKSLALRPMRQIWRKIPGLHIAPDNMTKASLMDDMMAAKTLRKLDQDVMEYHSLQICATEFGVLCPAHDLEFLSVLTALYDCDELHKETRRGMKEPIEIVNPQITLIAGTQPAYLSQFLPEAAWGQGFMSRIIMVYSDEFLPVDLFTERPVQQKLYDDLVHDAQLIHNKSGHMLWAPEAKQIIQSWINAGQIPVPKHLKLANYCGRRLMNLLKLSQIVCLSKRGSGLIIEAEHVTQAMEWLLDAEAVMPEVFKAMKGNSDHAVLQELKLYVADQYLANGGKPVHKMRLVNFLSERTPGHSVGRLLEVAVDAGLISKYKDPVQGIPTDTFTPGGGTLGPET